MEVMGSGGHQLCPSPCIHTYAHMYTQRHTFTHTHIIHLHTNTHIYAHTHKHTHTIYSHIYILIHIHIYTCIHIHTIYSHTYTLIHIHIYTHTHIALICTRINITLWQQPLGKSLFYSFFLLFFNILPISQTACLGLYRYMCVYIWIFFQFNLSSNTQRTEEATRAWAARVWGWTESGSELCWAWGSPEDWWSERKIWAPYLDCESLEGNGYSPYM